MILTFLQKITEMLDFMNILTKGIIQNHVDNRGWVSGLEFVIFVHFYFINEGWLSKKIKIMPTWLLNDNKLKICMS